MLVVFLLLNAFITAVFVKAVLSIGATIHFVHPSWGYPRLPTIALTPSPPTPAKRFLKGSITASILRFRRRSKRWHHLRM